MESTFLVDVVITYVGPLRRLRGAPIMSLNVLCPRKGDPEDGRGARLRLTAVNDVALQAANLTAGDCISATVDGSTLAGRIVAKRPAESSPVRCDGDRVSIDTSKVDVADLSLEQAQRLAEDLLQSLPKSKGKNLRYAVSTEAQLRGYKQI